LGIGDWGLGPIPNPQSPIPNPQSPIPIYKKKKIYLIINRLSNKIKYSNFILILKMIKIGLRNNLLYPFLLIIFTFLRRIFSVIISEILGFQSSLSFLAFLMIFSEFITGLVIYLYQTKIILYKKMAYRDSKFKVYFLIFIATFFDFIEFILTSYILFS